MTEDELVDATFTREGWSYEEPPKIDQPTGPGGITLPVLQGYRQGKSVTLADLKKLTIVEARAAVKWKLAQISVQHGLDQILFAPVRVQMVDFCYNSGEGLAIRWLQRVLNVPRTSVMDAATVEAVNDPATGRFQIMLNQALIAARLQMIDLATDAAKAGRKGIDAKFEEGLENRALTFSLLVVP